MSLFVLIPVPVVPDPAAPETATGGRTTTTPGVLAARPRWAAAPEVPVLWPATGAAVGDTEDWAGGLTTTGAGALPPAVLPTAPLPTGLPLTGLLTSAGVTGMTGVGRAP